MKIILDYVSNSSSSSFVFGKPGGNDWSIERVAKLYQQLEQDWLNTIYDMENIVKKNTKVWTFVEKIRKDNSGIGGVNWLRGVDGLQLDHWRVEFRLAEWLRGDRTHLSKQFPVLPDDMVQQIRDRVGALESDVYGDIYGIFFEPGTIEQLKRLANSKNPLACILGTGQILDCRGLQYNSEEAIKANAEYCGYSGLGEVLSWYSDVIDKALVDRGDKQLGLIYDEQYGIWDEPEYESKTLNQLLSYNAEEQFKAKQAKEKKSTGEVSTDYLEMVLRVIHETLGQVIIFGGWEGDGNPFQGIQRYLESTLDHACVHMG